MSASAIHTPQPALRPFVPSGMEEEDIPDIPETSFGELVEKITDVGFSDLVDVINPLQHIPILSNIYRAITEDEIGTGARLAGGALYGGPVGIAAAGLTAMVEGITGESVEEQVASLFGGDEDPDEATPNMQTPRNDAVQLAALPPEDTPAPKAAPVAAAPVPVEAKPAAAPQPQAAAGDAESLRIRQMVAEQQRAQAELLLSTIAKKTTEDKPMPAVPEINARAKDDSPAAVAAAKRPATRAAPVIPALPAGEAHPWVLPASASPELVGKAMEQALAKYQKVLDTRRN